MDELAKTLDFVKENIKTNLSLLNFIEENPIYSAEKLGNSVLVRGMSEYPWTYIESGEEKELKGIIAKLTPEDNFFAAIQDWIVPYLLNKRRVQWNLKTRQFFLPEQINININSAYEIFPLEPEDVEHVHNYTPYKEVITPRYIKDRIMKGFSTCIREDGKPVAWMLTHDDGAIGCLYVLKEYRNRGYGRSVCGKLCEKLRKNHKNSFFYLGEKTPEAEGFFSKLGFEKNLSVNWLCLE